MYKILLDVGKAHSYRKISKIAFQRYVEVWKWPPGSKDKANQSFLNQVKVNRVKEVIGDTFGPNNIYVCERGETSYVAFEDLGIL